MYYNFWKDQRQTVVHRKYKVAFAKKYNLFMMNQHIMQVYLNSLLLLLRYGLEYLFLTIKYVIFSLKKLITCVQPLTFQLLFDLCKHIHDI